MSSVEYDFVAIFGNLSEVELLLLEFIAKHGLVTKSIWLTAQPLSKISPNSIASAIRNLTRRKIVVARPLHFGIFYFAFAKRSVEGLRLPPRLGNPLNEKDKLRAYARMLVFAHHKPTFEQLDKNALSERLGEPLHGFPRGFYKDTIDKTLLGFMRVDSYIQSSPDRSAQVLRSDVLRLVSVQGIVDLIKRKQFEITWVTATRHRAESVIKRFRSYERVGSAPINIIVLPELIPLVTAIQL